MSDSGRGLLGGEYPDPGTPGTGTGSGSSGGVNVYGVPGGGRVISWQEPNPNYDPTQPDLMLLYKISPYTTKTQYIADSGASGSGGLSPNTAYSEQAQNARSAASLDEQKRQYDETFGMNKARGDQQQQLAEGNALGTFRGQPTLGAQNLALDRDKFGFDQFKYLSDLKANPRNFMQSFDILRGYAPRMGSEQFGTNGNLPGYGLGSSGGYATPSFMSPSRGAAPAAPQTQGGPNPYAGTNVNYGGSPTMADTAMINGVKTWAGGPYSGRAVDQSPANAGDLTPYLQNPNTPDPTGRVTQHFANGGVTPEPIDGVGRFSGKRYTIGEKGPEGIVPSSYLPKFLAQRHGQMGRYAVGGILGFDDGTAGTGDPYNPTPAPLPPTPNDPSNPYSGSYNPYDPQTTQSYGPQVPAGYGPVQTPGVDYGAAGAALAAGADATNPNTRTDTALTANTPDAGLYGAPTTTTTPTVAPTTPPVQQQTPTQSGPFENAPPVGSFWDPISKTYVQVQGAQIDPSTIRQPTQLPQGGGTPTTDSSLVGGLMPRDVAPPGTFGNLVGDSFNTYRPYLPQFLSGEDTPLSNLVNQGVLPSFLGRIFAQQHGSTEFGTNQGQRLNLPPDVPLISKIAYSQMSPSERSTFQSYISSYGIDPNDYFDYVNSVSPQGASSHDPLFGTPFSANIGQV